MIRLFEQIDALTRNWYHLSRKAVLMLNKSQPLFLGDAEYAHTLIERRGRPDDFYVYKAIIKESANIFVKADFNKIDAPDELKQRWIEETRGAYIIGGKGLRRPDLKQMSEFCFSWGDNKNSKRVMDPFLRKAKYDGFLCSDQDDRIILGILNPSVCKLKRINLEDIN